MFKCQSAIGHSQEAASFQVNVKPHAGAKDKVCSDWANVTLKSLITGVVPHDAIYTLWFHISNLHAACYSIGETITIHVYCNIKIYCNIDIVCTDITTMVLTNT